MAVKPVQWSRLRYEYERGATYQELAERYGVSVAAVGRRSKTENWGKRGSALNEAAEVSRRLLEEAMRRLEGNVSELSVKEMKELASLVRELMALRQSAEDSEADTAAAQVRLVLEDDVEKWSV